MSEHGSLAEPFAGDLFLTLAAEGRLVIDAEQADELLDGLTRTLAQVRARLRLVRIWHELPHPAALTPALVDAAFTDQLAPGRLEQAAHELPKYIAAVEAARRLHSC
jgi:hypothetical protein